MIPSFLLILFLAPFSSGTIPSSPIAVESLTTTTQPLTEARNVTATYWQPQGELGDCGVPIEARDYSISVPAIQFAGGAICLAKVGVTYQRTVIQATVVTLCAACNANQVNLTIGAFASLAGLNLEEIQVTLNYSDALTTASSTSSTLSSTASTSSPSSLPPTATSSSKSNISAIIGGTTGGIAGLIAVVSIMAFICHMRTKYLLPTHTIVPYDAEANSKNPESISNPETTLTSPTLKNTKRKIPITSPTTSDPRSPGVTGRTTRTKRQLELEALSQDVQRSLENNTTRTGPGTEEMAAEIARLRAENQCLRDQQGSDLALELSDEGPPAYS